MTKNMRNKVGLVVLFAGAVKFILLKNFTDASVWILSGLVFAVLGAVVWLSSIKPIDDE